MKITYLLMGCLVLAGSALVANALTSTVVSTADTYVEYGWVDDYLNTPDKENGDIGNRNSKGYLKQQWSNPGDPNQPDPNHGDVCKAYIKFPVPSYLISINSVTLELVTTSTQDNVDDAVEIWVLPDSMDDWNETVLNWTTSVSTYGNQSWSRYFWAGEVVSEPNAFCEPNKSAVSHFGLDASVLESYADAGGVITLAVAAMAGNSFWEDHEDGNYYYNPKLFWDYEIPEPVTVSMLLGGGALWLIRRRRI